MKLIIQIPCYNEEETLPITLDNLPKRIDGVDKIEILLIDDGSTDRTVEVAKKEGVGHILQLPVHQGLAEAFRRGIEKSLELSADIIVNTDGDNQYKGQDIPRLIRPILDRKAEVVVGSRDISSIKHFSLAKKLLQKFGSYIVRKFSNTDIPDTTSGFRAYSSDAALRLNVFSSYTYTLETIIQIGRKEIPISYVNVHTNEKLRESRLIGNIPSYIAKSVITILRIYLMYEPMQTFFRIGTFFVIVGAMPIIRFLVTHFAYSRSGHIQSVIIGSSFIVMGLICFVMGLLGDVISANRKLNEDILYRLKRGQLDKNRSSKGQYGER